MQGALAALGWLGALTVTDRALAASPTIANPSFEANSFTVFPGYHHQAGNGVIVGWTPSGGAGLNPSAGSPFADNGVVPNGSQVAFIQNAAGASLSTVIADLTVGETYKVNFRVNARGGNTANLRVNIDGTDIINTGVTSVGGANAYKYFAFDFIAAAASQTLTLHNNAGGDNTVVIDDFSIATRNSGWSYAAWTDEASAVPDAFVPYTHAYNFGSAAGATLNSIPFTGVAGGNPAEVNKFSTTGLPNVFGNDGNNLADGSRALANDFLYGGPSQSLTITGLEIGAEYVATIYSVGWEDGTRAATFSVGNDRLTINQDHFGNNNGIAFSYRYTATDVSVTLNFNQLEGNSIHVYGFSNYELSPPSIPQIVNGSFEADALPAYPGYASITGWSLTGGGINSASGPFHDNGVIPDGTQVAFIQADGALSQVVSGFVVGSSYQIRFSENARNCCSGTAPFVEVKVAGNTVVAAHASPPVGGANAYRAVVSTPFIATASSMEVAFIKSNPQGGDTTLLIDNVGFLLPGTAPTITVQPSSQTVGKGTSVTLTVAALGSSPLGYQWRKGGADISGAIDSSLTFSPVAKSDAGTYSVRVSNAAGNATSADAVLVVRDNVTTIFNTGVDDTGAALPDGTVDSHYTLVVNPDGGASTTFVEDSTVFPIVTGPWVANNAGSKWIGPRTETSGAAGAEGSGGDYVYRTLVDLTGFDPSSVVVAGDWSTDNAGIDILINGVSTRQANTAQFPTFTPFTISSGFLAGLNAIEFRINNAAVGYTGLRVDRVRALGTALPPGTAPYIVEQPHDTSLLAGERATFRVRANGSAPLDYQWYYGADPLLDKNGPELSFTFDFADQAGEYSVEISSPFGVVRSVPALLIQRDAPLILSQPQSVAVAVGEPASFSVSANGLEPLSYQWTKNGTAIPGANNPQLNFASATADDAGIYAVRISNTAGAVTSANVTFAVLNVVPGVFNTGVDASGAALADNTVDSHYTLVVNADSASSDAIVQDSTAFPIVTGPWAANDAGSKWIGPRFNTTSAAGLAQGNGTYVYRISFDLTGFDRNSVVLSGGWAVDNGGLGIRVNGTATGIVNNNGFGGVTAFTLSSANAAFVAGVNTLDFEVQNVDTVAGWTGLLVRNIRALGVRQAQPPTVVISTPADGGRIEACTTANICATATADAGASIAQVVFMAEGIGPIGVATSAPYCIAVPNVPAGAYVLTAIATDSTGKSTTSTAVNVTVSDTTPPVVVCPGDISTSATSAAGGIVTYAATGSDSCGSASVVCVPASGSTFPVGETSVTCTATDTAGNTAICSFKVTVRPNDQPPTAVIGTEALVDFTPDFEHPVLISCNWWNACLVLDGWTSSAANGGALTYLWFDELEPVPFDSGVVTTNCYEVGTHTITLIVEDSNGLTGTDSKTIEVLTAPLAIELLIEKVNQSRVTRSIKRELVASLRVALNQSKDEQIRPTQNALDAFEKKVRAKLAPVTAYRENARVWIKWSQAVSTGMEKCIKPPTKAKDHWDDKKDGK